MLVNVERDTSRRKDSDYQIVREKERWREREREREMERER